MNVALAPSMLQQYRDVAGLRRQDDGFERATARPGIPQNDEGEQSPARDRVTLSEAGKERAAAQGNQDPQGASATTNSPPASQESDMSPDELREIRQLAQRDREVRAHEQAHLANAGQYAGGGASFSYQTGPNGRKYAIGGEVPIDVSSEKTPEETIQKMRTIRRAALAPANPSSADRRIAAEASKKEVEAAQEQRQSRMEDNEDNDSGTNSVGSAAASPAKENGGVSPKTDANYGGTATAQRNRFLIEQRV